MITVGLPKGGPAGQPGTKIADASDPAVNGPGSRGSGLLGPAVHGGLALVMYLVVWWGTAFRPVITHPAHALLDQGSADPALFVWSLDWWPYALGHGLSPVFTHEIGSQAGHSLAWVTTVPPLALLAAPLTVTAGPVVSFNVLAALALPVSAWAAFVLCRRLTGKFWPALVGGAVFGFSAYQMNHVAAGQLNLAFSLLLPVLAYLVVIWLDGVISSRTFVVVAGLALAVQFYLMMEVFADLTAIVVVSLLAGLAVAGRESRPEIRRLAKVIGLAYVIAVVLALPQAVYSLTSKGPVLKYPAMLDLASLGIPRPERTYGIGWLSHLAAGPNPASSAGYVGVPLLVVAVLLAVTRWSSKLVRFLSCLLAFIIVAAFGPVLQVDGTQEARMPWAVLWRQPLLRNAMPVRLMLFAYLVLAVATALFLAGPARRVPWARWARRALAVLVVAFIALDVVSVTASSQTHSVPAFISSGLYRHELSRGEVVVVISKTGNAGMLWQAQSGFYMRVLGGYFTEGISRTDLPWPVENLADPTPQAVAQFERFVEHGQIGAILVDVAYEPRWAGVFRLAGLVGHTAGGVIVYPTHGCQSCRNLIWAQPYSAARTGAQVPTANSASRRWPPPHQ